VVSAPLRNDFGLFEFKLTSMVFLQLEFYAPRLH
jgi:hypothetical protein